MAEAADTTTTETSEDAVAVAAEGKQKKREIKGGAAVLCIS